MEQNNNSEADQFWQEKETEYNGKIRYKTFTRLIGTLEEGTKELSGLLYIIDDKLIFEDFEKEGGLLGMFMKKKKSNWEKTTLVIPVSEITGVTEISQSTAAARISGQPGPSKPISGLTKLFSIIVNEVLAGDKKGYFFEVLDKSSLTKAIDDAKRE
ncbi:MAG: hypothetical protein JEY99_17005 [Spirochaetales bacterium]|nr:hypothetical protein [Spirochaetales bacterium]